MEVKKEECENGDNKNNFNSVESINTIILDGLSERSSSGFWIWHIFLMCFIPGVLNGMHISSYVFLGQMPDDFWCVIPELDDAGWTNHQMINISTMRIKGDHTEHGCEILNWDYSTLSKMSYEDALKYIDRKPTPSLISCLSRNGSYFHYDQEEGLSIVPEWDLVCENTILRTEAQGALALGKLIGAFIFGIVADKYGRRISFILSSIIYIISGPLAAFVPWYTVFILARIGIGIAGSGTYHTAYIILNEIASSKHRLWMSIFFSAGYPFGMLFLSFIAYLVQDWRYLQLTISLPALILLYHCFAIMESPRWLIKKDRIDDAYKIVFKKNIDNDKKLFYNVVESKPKQIENVSKCESISSKLGETIKELSSLYITKKFRTKIFICHFTWFVSSLSYYAIALNAENFSANRYIYVAITGLVEIPSYVIPIIILNYLGRRSTSQILFTIAGVSLLLLLAIPQSNEILMISVAMIGRLCISSVFAVVILHTSDMFPTEIRSSAIGTSSTFAHVGSISAPYIVDLLGNIGWYIPTTICAAAALLAALSTIFLPEIKKNDENKVDEEY